MCEGMCIWLAVVEFGNGKLHCRVHIYMNMYVWNPSEGHHAIREMLV